jgi:hypothetical protein
MASRSLQDHLVAGIGVARFAAHAQRLLRFQQLCQEALPHALRPYVRIANLRLGKLVIYAANSAVAAKTRQFTPRLTNIFSNEGMEITEIEVKVQAEILTPINRLAERPPTPGAKPQQALADLASTLPESSPLKGALKNLLKTITER